jgi:flavin reductase (DIM6/NTAB) family NADH-FMN oxidoreductase RutF
MPATGLVTMSWDEAITRSSPHPYALAVSVDPQGKPNAIGLGWWTVCSWEPPMIAIAVGPQRYSRTCIDHCGEFVLCLMGEEQAKGAWLCGTKSGRKIDKFKEAGFAALDSLKVKVPTIGESVVAFECTVRHRLVAGDHILYVGEVAAIRGTKDDRRTLFTLHYRKLLAIGTDGTITPDLGVSR